MTRIQILIIKILKTTGKINVIQTRLSEIQECIFLCCSNKPSAYSRKKLK